MHPLLKKDKEELSEILAHSLELAQAFLTTLTDRNVAITPHSNSNLNLPEEGLGAKEALQLFMKRYGRGLSASSGARYFGFVTGGATPAALAADWLTSTFDQNATGYGDSVAPLVELEALALLRELFDLPATFSGAFVTGATMSNFTGLALARQWVGKALGYDIAAEGLKKPIKIFAGTAHSSSYKALAMLGMGRNSLEAIPCLSGREAIDVKALTEKLKSQKSPSIVIANAGTVNTVDYDDIAAIAELKTRYPFWLHVDAAFGGFAALSDKTVHLVKGWNQADSITIDAHKWLNVPYDSAMIFTQHENLQVEVFQNAATYLGHPGSEPNFVHRTPENSRRFRALAAWMTLQAYGKAGYQEMVERACDLAKNIGERIKNSDHFTLLAPVSMNGVCFTLVPEATETNINRYLQHLKEDGRVFLTPTTIFGKPAIRISITNWQTTKADIELAWSAMQTAYQRSFS
ncbi:MAG: aspartate aminotransferase family protein [Trueperaceae bacterium]|nr:aspartate aminotransferase family protein [Trueperaceae bacterium]